MPLQRIGTVEEDCILYNAVSGLVDVDFLRDGEMFENGDDDYSKPGYLYVVNSDLETQSICSERSGCSEGSLFTIESQSNLSVPLDYGKPSSPPRSSKVVGIQDLVEEVDKQCNDSFQDTHIAPAPLRPRKHQNDRKKRPHDKAPRSLSTEAHSNEQETDAESFEERKTPSAVEKAIEQHLAQMKQQAAELRKMLSACEAKLSKMTEELAQSKSEQRAVSFPSFEPKPATFSRQEDGFQMVERTNERRRQGDPYMNFLHVDFADAGQVALLSHVNRVGMNAQRRRRQLPRALVAGM